MVLYHMVLMFRQRTYLHFSMGKSLQVSKLQGGERIKAETNLQFRIFYRN